MVEYWGLPVSIARAIALPQDGRSEIERSPHEKTLTQIVHVAERLSEFLLQGQAVLLSEVIGLMERTPTSRPLTHLEQVMDALEAQVPPLLDLLASQPMQQTDYRSLLLEAYQLLSEAADQSVRHTDGTPTGHELTSQTREPARCGAALCRS